MSGDRPRGEATPEDVARERLRWEREVLEPHRATSRSPSQEPDAAALGPRSLLYTPADAPQGAYLESLGFPGEFPFTRGVQPDMYRGRPWTMRQYAGFGTAEESNARYRYLLSRGQSGLSVAFDLPTQMGYDPDHPFARGEVGRVGVAISTLDDMRTLLRGIPLGGVSTSMTINATATILLALYVAVAREQGVDPGRLRGTVQNDILKEYVARGTYAFPPRPSLRLVTDLIGWCREHAPRWNPISISGYHIREAGCTAVQEVAFTLADGIAYVEAARATGLDVDEVAPRLSFFFNVHNDFLEEVAKFRAARRLWARLVRDRFGARNPESMRLRFHTQTAGSTLTAQQADNNVVRVTLQALAAVLGGTQSLHTNSKDEALALPSEASALLALRTQQVIASESGVAGIVDPLGGSYAVESLTDSIEEGARRYIDEIDGRGGMIAAIEAGYVQKEIQDAAYAAQRAVESGAARVVGVNCLRDEAEAEPGGLLRVDPALERAQVERVAAFRAGRGEREVRAALDAVTRAAEGSGNLMPPILDAVTRGATLGEVTAAMEAVFGRHRENVVF
ncbi:methylmalonyl-CoA mutase family protein [Myxococcota bacterium]|nr:methylmalonyl-CoA mutase family protein [Myxococcota bacterium]